MYIQEELSRARTFLRREMGLDLGSGASNVPINFTKDEINMYVKRFKNLDGDNKGYITVNDLRRYFKVGLFWFCVDVVEDQMLINNNITVSIWWVSKSRSILSLFFSSYSICLIFFLLNYTNNLQDFLNTSIFVIYI